jgi:hypothetical protein
LGVGSVTPDPSRVMGPPTHPLLSNTASPGSAHRRVRPSLPGTHQEQATSHHNQHPDRTAGTGQVVPPLHRRGGWCGVGDGCWVLPNVVLTSSQTHTHPSTPVPCTTAPLSLCMVAFRCQVWPSRSLGCDLCVCPASRSHVTTRMRQPLSSAPPPPPRPRATLVGPLPPTHPRTPPACGPWVQVLRALLPRQVLLVQ